MNFILETSLGAMADVDPKIRIVGYGFTIVYILWIIGAVKIIKELINWD